MRASLVCYRLFTFKLFYLVENRFKSAFLYSEVSFSFEYKVSQVIYLSVQSSAKEHLSAGAHPISCAMIKLACAFRLDCVHRLSPNKYKLSQIHLGTMKLGTLIKNTSSSPSSNARSENSRNLLFNSFSA